MPAGEKPFVMYRRGPMHFTIVPRGPKGWAQFVVWLALIAPLILWFTDYVDNSGRTEDFGSAVLLLLCGIIAWLVCGFWWMSAHSELVDVVVFERERRNERRRRERERQTGKPEQGS